MIEASLYERCHPICRHASTAAIAAAKVPPKKQSASPKHIWMTFVGAQV